MMMAMAMSRPSAQHGMPAAVHSPGVDVGVGVVGGAGVGGGAVVGGGGVHELVELVNVPLPNVLRKRAI